MLRCNNLINMMLKKRKLIWIDGRGDPSNKAVVINEIQKGRPIKVRLFCILPFFKPTSPTAAQDAQGLQPQGMKFYYHNQGIS
ncbi:hypothetical protein ASF12_23965 [Paenibacillus sp. Leaf72]|nr:hypothetical protein ASF12_23965 [Paenibacillus sp. Leaf72]